MPVQETKIKSLKKTTDLLIDKNKITILFNLLLSSKGFNQLKQDIDGINQQILSKQLKQLLKDGFVEKISIKGFPKKSIYSITKFGKTLKPIMNSIIKWQITNSKEINKIQRRNTRDSLYNYY